MMARRGTTILGMMAVVLVAALAFVALRSASDLWCAAIYTFTAVLLLTAVIAAGLRRGGERAFWFGFAVFGWGFFLLGLGPWADPQATLSQGQGYGFNRNLLTSRLVLLLTPRLRKEADDLEEIDGITSNTIRISHLLITLGMATCGGLIAALMRRRRRKTSSARSSGQARPDIVTTSSLIVSGLMLIPALWSPGRPDRSDRPSFPEILRRKQRYSEFLAAMDEPSLWVPSARGGAAASYRLLWLPSFHHPICVRIDRTGRSARLRAVVLDGKGGYEPGLIAIDRTITFGDDQWMRLESRFGGADFWSIPTDEGETSSTDGDRLIVEGVSQTRYHVVDRKEPDRTYEELCRSMLELSGLRVRAVWEDYHSTE
jgi:hypothetical protein